jgi:hypothetical protein
VSVRPWQESGTSAEEEARLALVAAAGRYAQLDSVAPVERAACKNVVQVVARESGRRLRTTR